MKGEHDYRNAGLASITPRIDRRRLLQVLGAGAAVTLGTNAVAAGPTLQQDEIPPDQSGDGIHPVFGFSALAMDVDPPVEPDHVVDAMIQPREDREIPEFFFEPTGLYVEPGDTVQFRLVTPHHSVTAYHPAQGQLPRVPDDVPPFSSPVLPVNAYWLYTFEQPGVYDMHCGPHEIFGHVMRIVAGEATGPGAEPVPEPETMAEPNGDGGEMADENGPRQHGDGHEDGPHDHEDGPHDHENGPHQHGDGHHNNGNGSNGDGAEPDEDDAGPPDDAEGEGPELRPPVGAALTVLGDSALEPERIIEEETVSWEEIDDANKELVL
ncbi:plastocyanin [Natronolimnohabitans innermongolicus]|uniref:plastocyanin n=1 Tax=Natronolimnohabitans innermongolicus TaxID=253107 RepID=UPI000677DFA5|nr:plastocyanin [Natronolimnohabitans innermongolicus]